MHFPRESDSRHQVREEEEGLSVQDEEHKAQGLGDCVCPTVRVGLLMLDYCGASRACDSYSGLTTPPYIYMFVRKSMGPTPR